MRYLGGILFKDQGFTRKLFGKRRLSLLLNVVLFCVSAMAIASPSSPNEVKYIWRSIPFIAGADLYNFQNTFSRTREQARQEMGAEAMDLMMSGALGYEALMMILKFDELFDYHRYQAMERMDVTLEFQFKAALQDLFNRNLTRQPRLAFLNGNGVNAILAAARKAQKLRAIDDAVLPRIDYLALGTFSPNTSGAGSIYVAIELIDLKGNPSITFDATASSPQLAAQLLAAKLFDFFHKTQFPSRINRDDGSKIVVLGTPTGDLNIKARCEDAALDCQHMGGRLPTTRELEEVHRWGRYNGGIEVDMHNIYCLAQPGYAYVAYFERYREQPIKLLNDTLFHYFCIK